MQAVKQSATEIEARLEAAYLEYEHYKAKGLRLDMSRGKPGPEQVALVYDMLDTVNSGSDLRSEDGIDCANYGELSGIPEMKRIFSELLGVPASGIFIGGNSSLNLMFDALSIAYHKGFPGSEKPWSTCEKVKFLCPAPGYDRHFAVSEYYGFELVAVPMTETGPDMDIVEKLVAEDASVKGIWCVPIYANPTGAVYSDETVDRLARMRCAAKDFLIMWDNAYCVHNLYGEAVEQKNLLAAAAECGNPNRVLVFGSTSKITLPGGGVSCIASSDANIKAFSETAAINTIGYDKVNQLRHARYMKDIDNVRAIMARHAGFLRPKFEVVLETLERRLGGLGIAGWTKPRGGYFISLDVYPGTAKKVYALCKEAGVTLTNAGAAFPYGNDPENKNLRIAPSYPDIDSLRDASAILCLAAQIAAYELILGR